jgi:quercetin dioxygenase-like cupin family protein
LSLSLQTIQNQPLSQTLISRPKDRWNVETVPGESLTFLVRSQDVGGAYSIMESVAQPGSGTPMHHHEQDEVFHVLDGLLTLSVNNELIGAGPGTVIVVPAGTPHCWKNYSDQPVRLSVTFVPGGVEPLFEQMAGKSPEELSALAQAFGTVVVGPPLP